MIYITDESLEKLLKEDLPYLDLSTWILEIGGRRGVLEYFCREDAVICGTEEVMRLCRKLNIEVTEFLPSGTQVTPGTVFFKGCGSAASLHMIWKVGQNILDYTSGIATRTRRLVEKAKAVNPRITIVTTRKNPPGTKELAVKGVLTGGGYLHRLGLSETVLFFKQHLNFLADFADFIDTVPDLKAKVCEKKILVEAENLDEAVRLCKAGVDGVQFDKVPVEKLHGYVAALREINPDFKILAAGGINENNVAEYAKTGIDAVVTTAVYFGKPIDMGTRINKI